MTSEPISVPITVAITRTVDPERAKEVAAWARAGEDLLRASPGFLGNGWLRPDPNSPDWHMLFRFADAESLAIWERSPERAWWVASAQGLVEDSTQRTSHRDRGLVRHPVVGRGHPRRSRRAPPRWKQMVSIFLVFYPLSLGANALFGALIPDWPLWARVFVAGRGGDAGDDLPGVAARYPRAASLASAVSVAGRSRAMTGQSFQSRSSE